MQYSLALVFSILCCFATCLVQNSNIWLYSDIFALNWENTAQNWKEYQIGKFPNRVNSTSEYYYQKIMTFEANDQISDYSFVMEVYNDYDVYINGILVIKSRNDENLKKRLHISKNYIIPGNNLLCVKLNTNEHGIDRFNLSIVENRRITFHEECEYNKIELQFYSVKADTVVKINSSNGTEIYKFTTTEYYRGNFVSCVLNDNYILQVQSPSTMFSFTLKVADGLARVYNGDVNGLYEYKFTIDSDAIPLVYFLEKSLHTGVYYEIYPICNNIGCKTCTLESGSLPQGLSLKSKDVMIYGTLTAVTSNTFKMKCSNDLKEGKEFEVTFDIAACPSYTLPYDLKIQSGTNGERMWVKFGQNDANIIIDLKGVENNKVLHYSDCLPLTEFLLIADKIGSTWASGSVVSLKFQSETKNLVNIAELTRLTQSNYGEAVDNSIWEYSSIFTADWNIKYNEGGWSKSKLSGIPNINSITRYYRTIYKPLIDLNLIDTLNITAKFTGGIIFYLNGNEVLRHNLPEGVEPATLPISNNEISNFLFEVPGNILKTGVNYLGIEIHRNNDGSAESLNIKINPLLSKDKCVIKTRLRYAYKPMTITSALAVGLETLLDTIDLSKDSSFNYLTNSPTNINAKIKYKYPDNIRSVFNQYSIYTISDCANADPKAWEIYGYYFNGNDNYETLDTISDGKIPGKVNELDVQGLGRWTIFDYKIPTFNTKSFYAYEFNLKDIKQLGNNHPACPRRVAYSDFYVSNCKLNFCSKTIEGVIHRFSNNELFTHECSFGFVGQTTEMCSVTEGGASSWTKTADNCTVAFSNVKYSENNIIYFFYNLRGSYIPVITGYHNKFKINKNLLPSEISFNEVTGEFSGLVSSKKQDIYLQMTVDLMAPYNQIESVIRIRFDGI